MLYSLIGLVVLILVLIAAFEILTSAKPVMEKVLWLLLIFLVPLIGVIIYFLIGRGK